MSDETRTGRPFGDPASLATSLRRVVTGNDARGRSMVVIDGPPDPVLEFAPGEGLYEAWSDDGEGSADAARTVQLLPLPGGAKLRWFTVRPIPEGVPVERLRQGFGDAFRTLSEIDVQPDISRHPGMHKTATLDFIIVVSGQVRLLLDEGERTLGPGDVVVQRATNHAWVCEGSEPALLVAVLLDRPDA